MKSSVSPSALEIQFIPPLLSYITHINDSVLASIGCHYLVADPQTASKLFTLAAAARTDASATNGSEMNFEIRNKLIFRFEGQPDTVVRFSQKFSNLPHLLGAWNGESTRFQKELIKHMYAVVRDAGLKQLNDKASPSCGE